MLTVHEVSVIEPYALHVTLSNGIEGVFDMSPYLHKGIFTQLREREYFKLVRINFCGVCWPKGQDLSADTLVYGLKKSVSSASC